MLSAALAGTLALSALAPAQRLVSYGSGGFGMNSAYAKLYNRATVVTFHGKISGITIGSPMAGVANSVRLIVRSTNGGSSLVEVGPQWFVNYQPLKFHVKDKVTVTGSKIFIDGRGSIMAQKIVIGRQAMVLRSVAGQPFWAATEPSHSQSYIVAPNETSGTAAQPLVSSDNSGQAIAAAVPQQLAVLPVNATVPVYMTPALVNGVVDHFAEVNGNIFMYLEANPVASVVDLGPAWYISRQDVTVNPGDVVVANVYVPLPNPSGIAYAQSVTAGNGTLYLLNDVGMANWQTYYQAWPSPRPMPLNP